jgi:hypothetical protein
MMTDELITIAEAARIMGTTRDRVHELIRRGELTPLTLPVHNKGTERPYRYYLRKSQVAPLADGGWRRYKRRGSGT